MKLCEKGMFTLFYSFSYLMAIPLLPIDIIDNILNYFGFPLKRYFKYHLNMNIASCTTSNNNQDMKIFNCLIC